MKNLKISATVLAKLHDKHQVTQREVEQCFENKQGKLLTDNREHVKTDPPTLWFLAPTNSGRLLKIVYIQDGMNIILKSCFEPIDIEIAIYKRHG